MKLLRATFLGAVLMSGSLSANAELRAGFGGALICPESKPDKFSTMACNMGNKSLVSFYVTGENIVGFKDDSLKLSKLMRGKKSLLKNELGEDNYSLGSFAGASEDGKMGDFSIILESGFRDTNGGLDIEGEITVLTGSPIIQKDSKAFNPGKYSDFRVGPVKVFASNEPKKEAKKKSRDELKKEIEASGEYSKAHVDLFFEMYDKGLIGEDKDLFAMDKVLQEVYPDIKDSEKQAVGGMVLEHLVSASSVFGDDIEDLMKNEGELAIRVEYDETLVDKFELIEKDGSTVASNGYYAIDGKKRLQFEQPKSKKVRLRVYYRKTVKPVTVKINS